MQRIGSREFKNRLGRYLLLVRRGHTLLVTDRGRPVARVSPPHLDGDSQVSFSDVLKKLEAAGKIRLAKGSLGKFRAVKIKGKPASQSLLEDRR